MIQITPDIRCRFPNAFRKVRKEKIRCVRLDVDLYYVARVAEGHGRYLVKFYEILGLNKTTVKVLCKSVEGHLCRGGFGDRLCAHAAAAINAGIRHGRKNQRQAA